MAGIATTGTWALGATSMTVTSATGIEAGQYISATGIPVGAIVTGAVGLLVSWTSTLPAIQPGAAATVGFLQLMTVSTFYSAIQDNLMGRPVPPAKMAEAVRKTILEFTETYKFTELEETGPTIAFIVGQPNYAPNYFLNPGDAALKLNKVNSFFLFTDPYAAPQSTLYTGSNAGYNITFRTADRMEVLINTSGMPLHWTRYDGSLWFGCNPDQTYNAYMRYQREHPFPNAGTNNAGSDPIFMPDTWQEAVEYASSQRLAQIYNLSSKASELNKRLKGDEAFQRSAGIEGSPGLLFQLTSDENRDQSTTVKRFRLRMGMR
jgi:hypothetical protein